MIKIINIVVVSMTMLMAAGCKKTNVASRVANTDGEWRIVQAQVLYNKTGKLKFDGGSEYEYTSSNTWYQIGTYYFNDTLFSHTSTTNYTYTALYTLSASKDTMIFRALNYKFNYPHGGEPKDILVKQ